MGSVPRNLTLSSDQRDFALIDLTLGAPVADANFQELRFGRSGSISIAGLWYHQARETPLRRKDYVLAGNVQWNQVVDVLTTADDGSAEWFSVPASYRPGQQTSQRFFLPVVTAGLPDQEPTEFGDSTVDRDGDLMNVVIAPFQHGPDLYEWPFLAGGTQQMSVRRNGVEVGTVDTNAYPFEVPKEAADYEITLDSSRATAWWQNSTAISSVWKFRSAGGVKELMPLIVPTSTFRRRVLPVRSPPASRSGSTSVSGTRPGSPSSAFTGAKLELSYDGTNWTSVPLRSTGPGRYTTTVTHPRSATSVDLRITATDAAGGSLSQRITHAYGLTQ